jgi:putative holliday junction resolvase
MSTEESDQTGAIELPHAGVLLGIDYGTKRIGVAVSDRDQKFSSPLYNHQRQGTQGDTRFFRTLVEEYRPVGMVIGLPIHLSGDESEKSREARKFADWLSSVTRSSILFSGRAILVIPGRVSDDGCGPDKETT